jgi:hypothetical protein
MQTIFVHDLRRRFVPKRHAVAVKEHSILRRLTIDILQFLLHYYYYYYYYYK